MKIGIAIFTFIFVTTSIVLFNSSLETIKKRKMDTLLVNLTIKQATLVQKYVRDFYYYLRSDELEPIHATISTFENTQRAFLHGGNITLDPSNNLTIDATTDLFTQKKLLTIEKNWKEMKSIARDLIDAESYKKGLLINQANLLEKEILEVAKLIQKKSDQGIFKLQKMLLVMLIIVFILLIICLFLLTKYINFNSKLEKLVNEKTQALEKAQSKLLETAKQVGMSEIVTGILHNVGNVLNSINISAGFIQEKIKKLSKIGMSRLAPLIEQNLPDFGNYVTTDPKGKLIPQYIIESSKKLLIEQDLLNKEVKYLTQNVENIKDIISVQQSIAGMRGLKEKINLSDLIRQSLQVNEAALSRHQITVTTNLETDIEIETDRLKILQILINLISNAKDALVDQDDKQIHITLTRKDRINISISDNGVGIDSNNLAKVFQYGYTTKKDGHGFGLHNSSLACKELGGDLQAHSPGLGQGATFVLTL